MSRRLSRRTVIGLPATLLALALTACSGASDEPATATVGGVTLEVPTGWDEQVEEPGDDLVTVGQFAPDDGSATRLQVIVGCGDETADDLVTAAASQPRNQLVAVDADDAVEAEVPGMDTARRTTLSFGEQATGTPSLRVGGLYASGGGSLLLVELIAPLAQYDEQLTTHTLDSVEVARDEVEAACADA